MKHYTLCYYCAKATTSGCCWSKDLKPVEGWKAKNVGVGRQRYKKGRFITYYDDSWDVYRCPEFVEHELCKTDKKWQKELAASLAAKF